MEAFFLSAFGLTLTTVKKRAGYANENYYIEASENSYILKTYTDLSLWPLLEAEIATLQYLAEETEIAFPKPIPFLDGSDLKIVNLDGAQKIVRLLTYLPGTFMGELPPSEATVVSLGTTLAQLNKRLLNWTHPVITARNWTWNLNSYTLCKPYIKDISEAKNRKLVEYFIQQYETEVIPKLHGFRKTTLYNDANEWNILVENNKVSGFIDFGDLAYAHLVNDVAIAIAYVCYDKSDPIYWATVLLKAYHAKLPLTIDEVNVLYYTIALRLCLSVCNAAHTKKQQPENEYITVSEDYAWGTLQRWVSLNPIGVANRFKKVLGYETEPVVALETMLSKRHQVLSKILSVSYERPIPVAKAAFQYMYDNRGNTFLDAYNNIPHVGHAHPKVVAAGQKQMATLNTNTRYLYDLLPRYAEKLLAKLPPHLNKLYMVNSGSEASDLAIRIARAHTQRHELMVVAHGYHGHTQTGIEISDYKFNNAKGIGRPEHIVVAPLPTHINGKFATPINNNDLVAMAKTALKNFPPVAAFISETILGCAGQVALPPGYLKAIYPIIRAQGGVCIVDEVQTGFGRMGKTFWAFELQDVVPDIVVMGKPMGNGHPIGAVATTDAIAASFEQGVEFFSSFGGNPVSCAIAESVLDVIAEEGLQDNALLVGNYYKTQLQELQKQIPFMADVRGEGLFVGVEIVDATGKPDTALARQIKNDLREKHILISTDGPYDNVLKSKPPLCFTQENVDFVVQALAESFSDISKTGV